MEYVSTQEVPMGCVICGEVTRHLCPYALAPITRWECEHASEHPLMPGKPPRSNVYPLFGPKAG